VLHVSEHDKKAKKDLD